MLIKNPPIRKSLEEVVAKQPPFLRFLRYVHNLLSVVFAIFIIVIAVNSFVFTIFSTDGQSMQPTLMNGQKLPVLLSAYWRQSPNKGDIVILHYSGDVNTRFVKRILGLPGETLTIDGKSLVLAGDEYFVAGDNRDHSTDSRTYGPIKASQIIGKVLAGSEAAKKEFLEKEIVSPSEF